MVLKMKKSGKFEDKRPKLKSASGTTQKFKYDGLYFTNHNQSF